MEGLPAVLYRWAMTNEDVENVEILCGGDYEEQEEKIKLADALLNTKFRRMWQDLEELKDHYLQLSRPTDLSIEKIGVRQIVFVIENVANMPDAAVDFLRERFPNHQLDYNPVAEEENE